MNHENTYQVTVVGAGLAGALMAVYLGRAGCNVDVFEKRPDLRRTEISPGRSINLALSTRGLHALDQVGLADEILASAVPMRGRMIHAPSGALMFQPYSKNASDVIHSVSRAALNIALLNAAERCPGVRLNFCRECTGVQMDAPAARLRDTVTHAESTADGDLLIGADGAFSVVRYQMQRMDRFDYRQSYLEHGYKELTIPPGPAGSHKLERNALHIWPRKSFMMIALPNSDGSFTCTIFWPFEGCAGLSATNEESEIVRFFNRHFPDVVPLMPTFAQDFIRYPTSSLMTVRCRPWHVRDKVVLLGDACHAVVPFYGQGINAGFEDCVVLRDCLTEHAPDLRRAFETYERLRRPHTDALAKLAIDNFVEMRDHAASPAFILRKKRELWLHRWFTRWYRPLYSMVTFSRIPYADAVSHARRQQRAIRLLTGGCILVLALALVYAATCWMN